MLGVSRAGEVSMAEPGLDADRDAAIVLLTTAYSRDVITTDDLERRMTAIADADTVAAVRQVVQDLTAFAPAGPSALAPSGSDAQVMRGSRQSLRKEGHWLRSRRIVIEQEASSIRLDLDELAERSGEIIEIELALKACSCRIRVPRGTRVEEDLEEHMSSFSKSRSLTRHESRMGCTLVLKGTLVASSVRISRSRGRVR
jgi:hypothetical protein